MKKQIKRKIYLLKRQPMKPIEVVQYETGVQLVFEIQDIELDTTATATMFVRKPSGKFVFQEDNISLTGNTVVIDLHNQAITEWGHPFFQIKFKKDEEVISTYSGMLTVEKSLDDSGAEESKTVIAAFDEFTDEQIARIEEATQTQIDLMKAEVEAKGETVLATIPDEYTEMYNRVNTLFNSVANAIKGTVSGSVVRVDDVSPVEHKPVVKVVCPEGVDPTTVTVKRCGKNLCAFLGNNRTDTQNGVTVYKTNNSASFVINGTATAMSSIVGTSSITLPAGTYTASVKGLNKMTADTDRCYLWDQENSKVIMNGIMTDKARTFTLLEATSIRAEFVFAEGTSYTNKTVTMQIEKGEVVSEFEEYNADTYTPSSDGTVEGITSLSPTITLLTDTEGVTIECEYNKDTGKVIEKLTNAVVALGGVV